VIDARSDRLARMRGASAWLLSLKGWSGWGGLGPGLDGMGKKVPGKWRGGLGLAGLIS
jgi:hypothetical protein